MKKYSLFGLLCLLLAALLAPSCRNDDDIVVVEPDTLRPSEWLPAYPGSFWIYDLGGSYDTVRTSATYEPHPNLASCAGITGLAASSTLYVPVYDGQVLYRYHIEEGDHPPFYDDIPCRRIFSETVGEIYQPEWVDYRNTEPEQRQAVFKGVEGADSVILTEGRWPTRSPNVRFSRYVKGIGLVSEYIVVPQTQDTLTRRELTSYFIAR